MDDTDTRGGAMCNGSRDHISTRYARHGLHNNLMFGHQQKNVQQAADDRNQPWVEK
jgi:hypothetical protein